MMVSGGTINEEEGAALRVSMCECVNVAHDTNVNFRSDSGLCVRQRIVGLVLLLGQRVLRMAYSQNMDCISGAASEVDVPHTWV